MAKKTMPSPSPVPPNTRSEVCPVTTDTLKELTQNLITFMRETNDRFGKIEELLNCWEQSSYGDSSMHGDDYDDYEEDQDEDEEKFQVDQEGAPATKRASAGVTAKAPSKRRKK